MALIKQLLCALSFHALKIKSIASIDLAECRHCERTWAVDTFTQKVFELGKK